MMVIITNNRPRTVMDWQELTEKEQKELDWYKPDEHGQLDFIRYKDAVYCLSEFLTTSTLHDPSDIKQWDGYHPESYWTGKLVKYCQDRDRVIMGWYHVKG